MRLAIISDIHGNFDALQAVFADIALAGVDRIVCLGDVVGYGAQPRECVAALREKKILTIAGNHDWAAIGKQTINYFNMYAKETMIWTRKVCTEEDKEWLRSLLLVEYLDGVTIVHGSLYAPENFDYVLTKYDAYLPLQLQETPVCFIGHSHSPINYMLEPNEGEDRVSYNYEKEFRVTEARRTLVNVGSVGQPRDENPRACYAIYDNAERLVRIRRVDYDIESAARKIREAGLPAALGERLKVGR